MENDNKKFSRRKALKTAIVTGGAALDGFAECQTRLCAADNLIEDAEHMADQGHLP